MKNEEHIANFAFLHIYGLFNDAVSSSHCVPQLRTVGWRMEEELERVQWEAVMTKFKALSQHSSEGNE